MKIAIETIPHVHQAYPTCGDYWEDENGIHIVVSDMGNEQMEWLVAIHELVEVMLMKAAGIPLRASTDYDKPFEASRANAFPAPFTFNGRLHSPDAEPGDSPDSPYQREHNFATAVERMVCAALGLKWADYESAVGALFR